MTEMIYIAQSPTRAAEVYAISDGERTVYRIVTHDRRDPVRSAAWPTQTRQTRRAACRLADREVTRG